MKAKLILAESVIVLGVFALLFALVNVVTHIWLGSVSPIQAHIDRHVDMASMRDQLRRADPALLAEAYQRDLDDIVAIIGDQTQVFPEYDAFVQFKMPAVATPTFNYDAAGFRRNRTDQGPWPPDDRAVNIFVFGGSTTMGSGVPDGETWPQFLQSQLQSTTGGTIAVYNFGQPAHFSSQEVAHFAALLRQGHVPDAAIFLDGLNEMIMQEGIPAWTGFLKDAAERLHVIWHRDDAITHLKAFTARLPVASLVRNFGQTPSSPVPTIDAGAFNDRAAAHKAWQRYRANRRMAAALADAFDVSALFVWQPTPYFAYRRTDDILKMLEAWGPSHQAVLRAKFGYEQLSPEIALDFGTAPRRIWCGEAFANSEELLFVDHAHYNARGNQIVAECVADALLQRRLVPKLGF